MESRWIWPFELLEKIGEGGMGVVYRARYVGNDRLVAVKLIPNEITADPTSLARFERELEVLKRLKHPNIVHCFGGSCESKQRFYAMEFVSGGTLSEYVSKRKSLPWEKVVDFAIQMCAALQHAHEHGIVHRDIKPGNFLLTSQGQLKLSDFGLASIVSEGRLTAAGRTVGTILYMAPEQIRGGPQTPSVDLYGLGCVIYELLVGYPPYSGTNAAEVLRRHLKDPVPHVVRLALDCPLELDTLICELLNKSPEQRPASAADVANRLNGILLPSRREFSANPDLLASMTLPMQSIVRKGPVEQWDSDTNLPAKVVTTNKVAAMLPWGIAATFAIVCLTIWFGWVQTSSELRQAEQTWVTLLETADPPTRVLAARGLGKFNSLSPETIQKLSNAASFPGVDVRIAALKTLAQHASECRPVRAELIRVQKVDENIQVRAEAGLALDAIQSTSSSIISFNRIPIWSFFLAAGAGVVFAVRSMWKKFSVLAQ